MKHAWTCSLIGFLQVMLLTPHVSSICRISIVRGHATDRSASKYCNMSTSTCTKLDYCLLYWLNTKTNNEMSQPLLQSYIIYIKLLSILVKKNITMWYKSYCYYYQLKFGETLLNCWKICYHVQNSFSSWLNTSLLHIQYNTEYLI